MRRSALRSSAAERCSEAIFFAVLPQQAVDGRDVVVDLLDGAAAVFGSAGHGDQVLARFDEREVLRDGVDVREDGVDERILGADDRRQRIALPPGFRDDLLTLRVAAGDREDRCGENRRRTDCECLFSCLFPFDSDRVVPWRKYMDKKDTVYGKFSPVSGFRTKRTKKTDRNSLQSVFLALRSRSYFAAFFLS